MLAHHQPGSNLQGSLLLAFALVKQKLMNI